jgi:hypothetical protein
MAWYEPRRRVGVYFPAPWHCVMRAWRELRYRWNLAWRAPSMERAEVFDMQRRHHERERLADEYGNGFMKGWQECYEACMGAVQAEMSDAEDVWEIGRLLLPPQDN